MYRYRNILAIIGMSMLFFTFFSCAPADEVGFLRVLDAPARIEIAGERNGVAFSAVIELGGEESSMTFSSPESLKGVIASMAGGVWGSKLGDVSLSGIPSEMIGAPIKAFSDRGEVVSAKKTDDGMTLIRAKSGEVVREYLIDSKSGLPVKITEKSADGALIMEIEIMNYTRKEE